MKFSWIVILIFTVGLSSCSSDGGEEYPYDLQTVMKDPKVKDAVRKAGVEARLKWEAKNTDKSIGFACSHDDVGRAYQWMQHNEPFTDISYIAYYKAQRTFYDTQLCAGKIQKEYWCQRNEQVLLTEEKLYDTYMPKVLHKKTGIWATGYSEWLKDSAQWKMACSEYRTDHWYDGETLTYKKLEYPGDP